MKQNKLLMILTAVFVILSGLLAGCTHDDVYDPNRGKNPLPDRMKFSDLECAKR